MTATTTHITPARRHQLSRLVLRGFKSIRHCDVTLDGLNVLIGPNGAGKSNFIDFFRLVGRMLAGQLQIHVGRQGGPDALLHFGRKRTEQLLAELHFHEGGYRFILEPTRDNRMIFAEESVFGKISGNDRENAGSFESRIGTHPEKSATHAHILPSLRRCCLYHFHDTGENALVKQRHALNDDAALREDGRNLAAFLYRLRRHFPEQYQRIVNTVRFVAPFFGDFHLRPTTDNPEYIELEWTEQGEDRPFKAHQLSDGTLRFICLAVVLNQPDELQPDMLLIDEPELGLHPRALGFLASMLQSFSARGQVVISTQSVTLINRFDLNNLIVVDREDGASTFTRLAEDRFTEWLREYTVGDLWEKNLLGGRS